LPSDFIFRRGDAGCELYFLQDGTAGVFITTEPPLWKSEEVRVLQRGEYFGEVAVLTGHARSSWVMSRTYSVCSVLPKAAIDDAVNIDPRCAVDLARSMASSMNIKKGVELEDLAQMIELEFEDGDELFEFLCDGSDGEAPSGVISWCRYQLLMQRLNVPQLDQKLLWMEIDPDGNGSVTLTELLDTLQCWKDGVASLPTSNYSRGTFGKSFSKGSSCRWSSASANNSSMIAKRDSRRRLFQSRRSTLRHSAYYAHEEISRLLEMHAETKDQIAALDEKVDDIRQGLENKLDVITAQMTVILGSVGPRFVRTDAEEREV